MCIYAVGVGLGWVRSGESADVAEGTAQLLPHHHQMANNKKKKAILISNDPGVNP